MAKKQLKTGKKAAHRHDFPNVQEPREQVQVPRANLFTTVSLALAILAALVYFNTLGHGFVMDDPLAIGENSLVRKGFDGIPELLIHHYRAGTSGADASVLLYRPVSLITFAAEWSLAPNSPFPGHLMNVLWFALTVGLLFNALRLVFHGYHWVWAAGTALLFAVHPVHTEVVANIKSRDEILCLFFSVAALYSWGRWLHKATMLWLILAMASYFVALLSKESAVMFLPAFPLAGWFFFNKNARQSLGYALLFTLPVAVFLLIRGAVLAAAPNNFEVNALDNPIVEAQGIGEITATGFMVLWKYLQLLLWPHPLVSDYSYRHLAVTGWGHWESLLGVVLYAGLLSLALYGILKRRAWAFLIVLFLSGMVLYSQLFIVIGTLLGERLLYAPSLWFCAGIAYVIWKVSGFALQSDTQPALREVRPGLAVFALIALAMGAKTISRNADWKSNLALFSADVRHAPQSVRLLNGLGNELYLFASKDSTLNTAEKMQIVEKIIRHSKTANEIRPTPNAYMNLGNAAVLREQYLEAITQYSAALELSPDYGSARHNISQCYVALGRTEGKINKNLPKALEYFNRALEYSPDDIEIYLNLGTTYGLMRRNEEAIARFEKVLQIDPDNRVALKYLGIVHKAAGNPERAAEYAKRAGEGE